MFCHIIGLVIAFLKPAIYEGRYGQHGVHIGYVIVRCTCSCRISYKRTHEKQQVAKFEWIYIKLCADTMYCDSAFLLYRIIEYLNKYPAFNLIKQYFTLLPILEAELSKSMNV